MLLAFVIPGPRAGDPFRDPSGDTAGGSITEWILGSEPQDDDGRGRLPGWRGSAPHPAPSRPRQNSAREIFAGGLRQSRRPDAIRTCGARGPLARGGIRKGLGAVARAPPVRKSHAFRARAGSSSCEAWRKPWRLCRVRSFGDRTPPSPARACQTRQGPAGPAFAVTPHAMPGQPARTGMRIKRRRSRVAPPCLS